MTATPAKFDFLLDSLHTLSPAQLESVLCRATGESRTHGRYASVGSTLDKRTANALSLKRTLTTLLETASGDVEFLEAQQPDRDAPIATVYGLRPALFAALGDLGYSTGDNYRPERLALLSTFTDDHRKLYSMNDMTVGEAQRALDALKNLRDNIF